MIGRWISKGKLWKTLHQAHCTKVHKSAFPTPAISTSAVPTYSVPTSAVPISAVPTSAVSTSAVPTSYSAAAILPTFCLYCHSFSACS